MRRQGIVIIASQSVVIVLILAYALMQRNSAQVASGEASAQRAIAERSVEVAEQARAEAEKHRAMAEKNAQEAVRQAELARQMIQRCK